jgi:hypothetical protein
LLNSRERLSNKGLLCSSTRDELIEIVDILLESN